MLKRADIQPDINHHQTKEVNTKEMNTKKTKTKNLGFFGELLPEKVVKLKYDRSESSSISLLQISQVFEPTYKVKSKVKEHSTSLGFQIQHFKY